MTLPLITELQRMAVTPETSVVQLVRFAKLVAAKLGLREATTWIDRELNGYDDVTLLPEYRLGFGECQGHNPIRGWIPVQFHNAEVQVLCSKVRLSGSLGSLEPLLAASSHPMLPLPFSQQQILGEMVGHNTKFAISFSNVLITRAFDAVRNLTLDWSLSLEQAGVLGENMSFTLTEKQEAKPVTQQFFIQNAGVIGNVSDNAQVTNHQRVTGSLNIDSVRDLTQQAKSSIDALPADMARQVAPLLDDLDRETSTPQPNQSKLKAVLTSIKTICEGAAGNIVASGIAAGVALLLK